MSSLKVVVLRSASELRSQASSWDDLWFRSTTTLPTARAALVAQWIDTLAPQAPFYGLAVADEGRWLAAIPLIGGRLRGMLKVARLPSNEWSWAGDLMVDPAASDDAVDLLVDGIIALPAPLVWFDGVPIEQNHWQRLLAAIDRRRLAYSRHNRFRIGVVDVNQRWGEYESSWSSSFRRKMRKMDRRAEVEGELTHAVHRPTDGDGLSRLLQVGFEIEDRSWKGRDETSVIKSPQLHRFLCQQAAHLSQLGHLELHFLELNGRPIAFEYGMTGKSSYFSPKVGYDEEYAHLSPGQLLRLKMMQQFFADPARTTWDFLGPLVDATDRWSTGSYSIERLAIATRGVAAQLAICRYRDWWPAVRRVRDRWRTERPVHQAVSPCSAGGGQR